MSNAAQYAGRPVVIYGPQGCGKTRLLPRLAALCGKTRIVEEWWDGAGASTLDADSIADTGAPPPYASVPDAVALSYQDAAALVAAEADRSAWPNPACERPVCDGPRVRLPFSAEFVNCHCAAAMRDAAEADRPTRVRRPFSTEFVNCG
ncbi:hypothetical protein ACW73L_07355 [Methylolobus aquaticus]